MLTLSGSNGQRIKFVLTSFHCRLHTYRTKAKAKQIKETRMHSSRMRTGRSLTAYRSLLPGGGGVSARGGVCSQEGGVCSGGVCSGGCLLGGVVVSQHALRQTPPVNRITDTSKNITLATTSLRPVKTTNITQNFRFRFHFSSVNGCYGCLHCLIPIPIELGFIVILRSEYRGPRLMYRFRCRWVLHLIGTSISTHNMEFSSIFIVTFHLYHHQYRSQCSFSAWYQNRRRNWCRDQCVNIEEVFTHNKIQPDLLL